MADSNCYEIKTLIRESSTSDKLELCPHEASISDILEYKIDVKVVKCKTIKTCTGYKLIIEGFKILKICYASKSCCGKVLVKSFPLPFFETVPLPQCISSVSVKVIPSYCDVYLLTCNSLVVNSTLTFCIKLSFKNVIPKITCNCSCDDKCEGDWEFKNDCYPDNYVTPHKPIYSPSNKCCKKQVPNNCCETSINVYCENSCDVSCD